ncbi:hypothetical protein [Streptomyces solicathayae]|uniref:Permease n=1 Tax=Streptomyces solicathayae TaxID=3081768 RepID=A0ABZ0LXR6_9ACTN|nr:hypothetical protein [Streptomyces sp. HUAS YS2]WOX24322.1 hypothetical protein R2D22_24255 [Streptomyces sp. HUAS YS2]
MRRRGATAQLLAVGRRAADRGRDPRHTVQALCLLLAGVAAGLLIWGIQVNAAVYGARDARTEARLPVRAAEGTAPALWWADGADTVGDRAFSVVTVEPVADGAPLPPGLTRWPGPGEAFVSPALRAALPAADTRYGRLAGTIAPSGLKDPGELFVYRRPPPDAGFAGAGSAFPVTGFGAPFVDRAFFMGDGFDRAEADLYWLMAPLLGLPVVVLLVVAARLGARGRDRRLAVLHAMGAGRSVRARIAAGECLRPLAAGVLAAGALLTVPVLTGVTLPVTGYEIAARDLAALRWAFPLSLIAVWAVLCLAFAALHLRVGPLPGARPRAVRERLATWPGRFCGLGTLFALWGAMLGGEAGMRLFILGTFLALGGLPPLLGRAAAHVSGKLIRRNEGDPARLVGARWAGAHPGVLARTTAAIAVLLGLLAQVQIAVTELTTEAQHARALATRLDGRLTQVEGARDPRQAARFLDALAPGDRVLRVLAPDDGRPPVFVGDCRALAAFSPMTRCPRDRALPAEQVFTARTPRTEALRWSSFGAVNVRAATGPDELLQGRSAFIVLTGESAGGIDRVKRAAYRAFPQPQVGVPGADRVIGAAARARIADWVLLVAGAGLALLVVTGSASLLHAFLDRADELRTMAGYTSGAAFHLRVAWWGMGVPTVCALALATLFAGLLAGFNLAFLAPSGGSPAGLLGGGLTLAVLACAAATVAGGLLGARYTHRWVPRGD